MVCGPAWVSRWRDRTRRHALDVAPPWRTSLPGGRGSQPALMMPGRASPQVVDCSPGPGLASRRSGSGRVRLPGVVFIFADGVPGAEGLSADMPAGVDLAGHAAQRVIKQLVAVAICPCGFVIDVAVVIGEVRTIVTNRQPLVVVNHPATDPPAILADHTYGVAIAVQSQPR